MANATVSFLCLCDVAVIECLIFSLSGLLFSEDQYKRSAKAYAIASAIFIYIDAVHYTPKSQVKCNINGSV